MTGEPPALITINEAARLLGVNRVTIYRWAKLGHLAILRIAGACPRIERAEVDRLISEARAAANKVA